VVIVTLAIDEGVVAGEDVAMTAGVWEAAMDEMLAGGDDDGADDDDDDDGDGDDTKGVVAAAEVLVAVAVFVRELTIELSCSGSLTDDEGVEEAVLEGVVLEESVGVLVAAEADTDCVLAAVPLA
jgi:hypothetical protein